MYYETQTLPSSHPRRPRGGQSSREKRRDESFQAQAEKPLGTDSHWTISKRSSKYSLLIGHKKCFVLLCPIGEQFLLSFFRGHSCPVRSPSFPSFEWLSTKMILKAKTESLSHGEVYAKTDNSKIKQLCIRTTRIWNLLITRLDLDNVTIKNFKSVLYGHYSRALAIKFNPDSPRSFKTICLLRVIQPGS